MGGGHSEQGMPANVFTRPGLGFRYGLGFMSVRILVELASMCPGHGCICVQGTITERVLQM